MAEKAKERLKDACRVLGLAEQEVLIRLIPAYVEKSYEDFWGWIDALNRLYQLKDRICK